MTRLFFYLRYAANNLRRGGQWTVFALFCVAAGVATVVALRGLGLSITDSLLSNLRQYNHGDVNISQLRGLGPFALGFQGGQEERLIFEPDRVQVARDWAARNNAQMTAYILVSNVQIAAEDSTLIGRPNFASSLFIDPASFAAMNGVVALDPAGVPLDQLLTGPQDVVISANMAESLGVQVGAALRVSGSEQAFTLRGIPTPSASTCRMAPARRRSPVPGQNCSGRSAGANYTPRPTCTNATANWRILLPASSWRWAWARC
jgi:ABC-type lipoprotein release transport system permease subunit